MNNVLITGAGGFIGKNLTNDLLQRGIRVTSVLLTGEALPSHDFHTVVEGDLSAPEQLKEKLADCSFDTMYHLAWAGVGQKNDLDIQLKNIDMSLHAMDLALLTGCRKVICPGSVSEYAYSNSPVNGRQLPSPSDLYAATKVSVHTYLELLAKQSDISLNWVLIPSIYGPGRHDNNLITYAITTLLDGRRPSFTRLEQMWDYIYIGDLILVLYLVGLYGKKYTTYAAGCGKPRPMHEYLRILRECINTDAELGIGELPYKTDRIDDAVVDISELQRDTGFRPQIGFEEGISRTVAYFKEIHQK